MTSNPFGYRENWKRRTESDNVWQKKAHVYDKNVNTFAKDEVLRLYIRKEQEMLDGYIAWVIDRNPTRKISILEIGSGTGRTLLSYTRKPELMQRVDYLIGIDDAYAMCEIAKYKLEKEFPMINHNEHGLTSSLKCLFLSMKAERLSRYFDGGRVDVSKLKSEVDEEQSESLNENKYNESLKVVIIMLNTLGVIKQTKGIVLKNMVRAAGRDGRVVVSVFNGDGFTKNAENIYTSIRNMVGKFSKADFDYSKHEFSSQSYYSHWFTRAEIEGMMRKAGCTNIRTKEINNIGLFVTSEVSR
jgi:SAM-dependent methyltransferase